jgi:acyl carrier protein
MTPDEERILAEITPTLIKIIGEEYALDLDIGMGTTFEADLEFESIEFVALSTRLTERYGDQVDILGFLADKELDEIITLTVGDLVRYITASLTVRTAAAGTVDG